MQSYSEYRREREKKQRELEAKMREKEQEQFEAGLPGLVATGVFAALIVVAIECLF